MTTSRMHIVVSVGALLISVQLCLAADERREAFDAGWSAWGQQAKAELAGLPSNALRPLGRLQGT